MTGLCVWGCAANLLPLQIPSENWTNCANTCAVFVILLYKFTMNAIKCKVSNLPKNVETEEMYPFYEQIFQIYRKARTGTVRAKKKPPTKIVGGYGGDYRTRTCDLLRVKQAL